MKSEKVMESLFMIGYRKGIEDARRMLEKEAEAENLLRREYRRGRIAEARRSGDTQRVLDIQGGSE